MIQYVAFLRGINSGQNPSQKMDNLRRIFENLGFQNVKTVLASGNFLFESSIADRGDIEERIEVALRDAAGIKTAAIVRSKEEIKKLVEVNPFRKKEFSSKMKTYATFLKDATGKSVKVSADGKGYTILGFFEGAVCSVVDLSKTGTPDLMRVLEHEFGKNITTRNWNTVKKIVAQ